MEKTESQQRIDVSKNQIEILKTIFENIHENGFDCDIDLSSIPTEKLMDFWLYSTGFMCLQNFESDSLPFDYKECENIANGWFYLKSLSYDEARKLLADAGNTPKSKNDYIGQLYTVQDGKYSIGTSKRIVYKYGVPLRNQPCIILNTDKPTYVYFDNDVDITPDRLIHIIRNALAHDVPFVKGSTVAFRVGGTKNDYIEVSKMWLRGFSELFSQLNVPANENEVIDVLSKELSLSRNYLENEKQVENAISLVKNLFSEQVQNNFFRVHNFIKTRLKYEPDFYKKSLDEKIATIAAILSHSQTYLTESFETITPSIVYSLQQLVAKELAKRDKKATFYLKDEEQDEIDQMIARKDKAVERYDSFLEKYPILKDIYSPAFNTFRKRNPFVIKQYLKILEEIDKVEAMLKNKLASLKIRQKLENSQMELYNPESLKYLPVEVAANIVWLMGYNSLISSAIYEDLIAHTDFNDLNPDQVAFFSKFSFDKFTIGFLSNKQKIKGDNLTVNGIPYMLLILRSAICHGRIKYTMPPVKKGEKPNFQDVILTFYDRDDITISGKLIDFYNFFGSGAFTAVRKPTIITKITIETQSKDDDSLIFDDLGELEDLDTSSEETSEQSQPGDDDD